MINELSRCDSTRPGVDHGARRYRTVFHGEAGPHSDDHTSRSSSVYEIGSAADYRRLIRLHWCSIIARWINASVRECRTIDISHIHICICGKNAENHFPG